MVSILPFAPLRTIVGMIALTTLLSRSAVAQQQLRPLEIDEALGTLALAGRMPVDLSPDGRYIAYTVADARRIQSPGDDRFKMFSRTGAFSEALGCDVWITDTRTGATTNLTRGRGTSSNPVWSPNGRLLAFYSDRSGTYGLWLWEPSTNRLRQIPGLIPRPFFGFAGVRWSADSKRIVLKALPEGMTVATAAELFVERPKTIAPRERGSTVVVYESREAGRDSSAAGSGSNVRYLADVAVVDVASGRIHRVARRIHPVGYWISADGRTVVFSDHLGTVVPNTQQQGYDIVVGDVATARTRVLVPRALLDYGISLSWSPDGAAIAYTTSGQTVKRGELYVVNLTGGEPRLVSRGEHPSFSQDYQAPLWDPRGEYLYVLGRGELWRAAASGAADAELVAKIGGRTITQLVAPGNNVGRLFIAPGGSHTYVTTRDETTKREGIFKVDVGTSGPRAAPVEVIEREQRLAGALWTSDVADDGGTVIWAAQDARHPEDVWVADGALRQPRRATNINPQLDRVVLGEARVISWIGARGDTLRGALLLPAGYQAGRRYPLLVKVYAGSMLSNGAFRFGVSGGGVENMQLLATRGYAVLLPDVPQRLGTPMADIPDAVLPGVDRAIALGIADSTRLGVMGHSYGGYSTLSLIVQTTRFRAAMSSAGPANLVAMFGQMTADGTAFGIGWSETGQGLMGGTPWQHAERYVQNSPISYLHRVQTPLLIVQGAIDRTVPSWQADAVFVGLRRLGKEVVYAKYEGEDHWQGTWGHANAIDYWKRVIGWFDAHLKPSESRAVDATKE